MDFKGTERSNETHASYTDPDARLYKKSSDSEAKMAYLGQVMTENRNGLVIASRVTIASGTAEREAALEMVSTVPGSSRITLGGDKGYDTAEFVRDLRAINVTPHVAQNDTNRRSAIDGRTTSHSGYEISQQKRKRVEETFGWAKVVALVRKVKLRGLSRVGALFELAASAYNLVRMRKIIEQAA